MVGLSDRIPATGLRVSVNAHTWCGEHHPGTSDGPGEHEDHDERLPRVAADRAEGVSHLKR